MKNLKYFISKIKKYPFLDGYFLRIKNNEGFDETIEWYDNTHLLRNAFTKEKNKATKRFIECFYESLNNLSLDVFNKLNYVKIEYGSSNVIDIQFSGSDKIRVIEGLSIEYKLSEEEKKIFETALYGYSFLHD